MIDGPGMLEWLRARRSVRRFEGRPVDRAVLERVLAAAVTAPSSTNRQPWRFAVVTSATVRARIVDAVRERTEAMKAIIQRGHHAEEFGAYGDFFHEPLASAAAIVVPAYRDCPDQLGHLVASGGGDPAAFHTPHEMQPELCGASAAVMLLLLQARAEGLGACWMAGPTVARDEIERAVGVEAPWRMLGAIALGWAAEQPAPTARKPLDRVVAWLDDTEDRA